MGDTSALLTGGSASYAAHTLRGWRAPLALAACRQGQAGMAGSRRTNGLVVVRASTTEGSSSSSVSSSSSPTSDKEGNPAAPSASAPSVVVCKACGRAELESGCNGEGRIQGGIGALPGFDWWPIKAYRPCPAFIQSGGRYRRSGQSLNEIAFGRKTSGDDLDVAERLKRR